MESVPQEDPKDSALSALLINLMQGHPRPWRIDHDRGAEIYDASGERILLLSSTSAAELIIQAAIRLDEEAKAADALLEEEMDITEQLEDDSFGLRSIDRIPRFE